MSGRHELPQAPGPEEWDDRYRSTDLVWAEPPTPWVVEQTTVLPPGRALDVGTGEGHDAIHLATRGWDVTALDFSRVGLDKAATAASRAPRSVRARLHWTLGDITVDPLPEDEYDLAVWAYLQPAPSDLDLAITRVCDGLAAGGVLVLAVHERLDDHPEIPVFGATAVSGALPEDMVVEHVEWRDSDARHGTGVDLALRARRRAA
ncbi:class I SAM-dependent methyltransferase [Tsukamurella sp. 8F]|uniref:class I SAM-dependent methyltransferase n=1 Tax=unclassified Tsukamurella TaxID=2633480 RepID=UPI0023B8871F|nr:MULTISPECIES: class I SAM-dependent methyltransferase [unclassified Tsukamurella]MDF0529867.1 class I SAM-dependent methyltransferase [Tsukamurella sp. 8J]MDF0587059.1 class I SAM-dependent methyltransferase [Tsukamurella sp. 8F]